MLHSLKERFDREDEGFTLIELMVVVLIIAILLAIAIPTFLGARNSANARSAQSNLRNALTAEQAYWTNNQAFDSVGTGVASIEPSLTFQTTAASAGTKQVSLAADTANGGVIMSAAGKDGNCYAIEVINQPLQTAVKAGTYYQQSTTGSAGCAVTTGVGNSTPTQANASGTPGTWSLAF